MPAPKGQWNVATGEAAQPRNPWSRLKRIARPGGAKENCALRESRDASSAPPGRATHRACGPRVAVAVGDLHPWLQSDAPSGLYRLAAFGAFVRCADRIRARRTQAAPDASSPSQRERRGEEQPENRGVEQRVDREARPLWA